MKRLTFGRLIGLVFFLALAIVGCSGHCTYDAGESGCSMKCVSKPDKCRCATQCPCWTKHH